VSAGAPPPRAGLCERCRHARCQRSARGALFWRCLRADHDPAFRRYPPLPVERCAGFEEGPGPAGPSASDDLG
jgi:hypothetical protein